MVKRGARSIWIHHTVTHITPKERSMGIDTKLKLKKTPALIEINSQEGPIQ